MHLTPFVQVDDLPFSTTRAALLRRKGPPLRRFINDVALEVFDYGGVVFRFQASGRLEEVTQRAPVMHLGEHVAVPGRRRVRPMEAGGVRHERVVGAELRRGRDPGEPG